MKSIQDFLNLTLKLGDKIHISVRTVLFVILTFIITSFVLKLIKKLINRKLNEEDRGKFTAIYSFVKYFVYVLVLIIALESSGFEVGVLLAGSAALLVGVGLGLQTLFQDIMSGIFILIDKTLQINDVIEVENKTGKVIEIRLRTTRILTIDNRTLIIPNHKFLINSLYNWTQNGTLTTEFIDVGVAYGSDVNKVKEILLRVAKEHPRILNGEKMDVLLMDFGDNALQFRLLFSTKNSYIHLKIKSDLRFAINEKFKQEQIQIPFPQRDVHLIKSI